MTAFKQEPSKAGERKVDAKAADTRTDPKAAAKEAPKQPPSETPVGVSKTARPYSELTVGEYSYLGLPWTACSFLCFGFGTASALDTRASSQVAICRAKLNK